MKMKWPIWMWWMVLIAWAVPARAQEARDAAGEWSGIITQIPAGLAGRYTFSMTLEVQGTAIAGEARIAMEDDPDIYGVMVVAGEYDAGVLRLQEASIKQQRIWSYAYWCLKDYALRMRWVKGILVMEGDWHAADCAGSVGSIHLERRVS